MSSSRFRSSVTEKMEDEKIKNEKSVEGEQCRAKRGTSGWNEKKREKRWRYINDIVTSHLARTCRRYDILMEKMEGMRKKKSAHLHLPCFKKK